MAARAADFVPDPAPPTPATIVPPGYVAVPESFVNYALIYLSDRTGPANAIFTDLKAAYDAQTKTPMTCVPAKPRN